jgi:hypothetical protein
MTLGDWCDVAWSALFDDAPALANPSEYRSMMYEAFWNGNMPKPKANGDGAVSKPVPRSALAELEAERARIKELQTSRE